MVLDEEIKTNISPFAMREGEIKTFDGKDGYVSINQIINKINIGHITDIHFKILEIVNEFEFITSRQIYQILEARGIDCKWQPTDNTKPVAMIKKRLAGNQVIISYLRKVKAFDSYTVKPVLNAKQIGKTFKMHAGIKVSKAGKSAEILFEAVRREEDWEKKLIDRVRLLKDFFENFVPHDSGFATKPGLVLLCEDDKHTIETFKLIVQNKLEISNTKIWFTTDLKQNNPSLADSLTEFVLDEETSKYKLQELKMKILE